MNRIYLDTNIFIYSADKKSPNYQQCLTFFNLASKKEIELSTSTETIQEIIHLSQNTKQVQKGLAIVTRLLDRIHVLFPVDTDTIGIYIELIKKHPKIKSRDCIQAATAMINKIDTIITYDSDFKKFKEIKVMTPAEYLKNNKLNLTKVL